MVINCNSAKWYFCGQWSGYSGYRHPNHGHSLYPPPLPHKLLCAGVSLSMGTNSAVWYEIHQGSRRDKKKKSRDLRGGRWSWTFKLAQKRSWVGRWSWAAKVGPLSLRVVEVVRQQQSNRHYLCDSAQAQQLKQQMRSAQVAGQWRGDTALTLPLFWRRSTVSPVFVGWYPRSSLHSFVPPPLPPPPPPSLSPSLISHLTSVDVKQNGPRFRSCVRVEVEPSGFRGRKAILNHASALVSACP